MTVAPVPSATAQPAWLRPAVLALAALALFSMFSDAVRDADTWFHLRTGAYIVQHHQLPIPDPFSWTTYLGRPAYAGEEATRDLNLKHEWLSQVILYLVYAAGGFPAIVLFRAACLAAFCAIVGWVAWRRTGRFYLSIAAALAAGMRKRPLPRLAHAAAPLLLLLVAGERIARGEAFQLHVAAWQFPAGPVAFLKQHNVAGPMFNIYEWGGYLMWDAWPLQKTFVDGRALNESVFQDYLKIALNTRNARSLLDRYGVEVILLEGFEYSRGTVYMLGAALADPSQSGWKLVYQDQTGMVFMRLPPPGVQSLPPEQVLASYEAQCAGHLTHQPELPRCARGLGDLYARIGSLDNAARWLEFYLSRKTGPDAERLYRQIRNGSYHAPSPR